MLVKVLTGAFFGVTVNLLHLSSSRSTLILPLQSLFADPILGGCAVYDLVALYSGQQGDWSTTLGWFAVGSAAIVGLRNIAL